MKKYKLCQQLFGHRSSNSNSSLSPDNLQWLMHMYRELTVNREATQELAKPLPGGFPEGEHFSTMVPADIQHSIRRAAIQSVQYQHSFVLPSGRTVRVYIWFPSTTHAVAVSDMIRCIYMWFAFLDSRVSKTCSRMLTIYVYMTPFTKKLPKIPKQELSEVHVNSAFTFSCQEKNVIYVFRQEEWLKVLIHESIHALGIDFSWYNDHGQSTKQILKIFPQVHAANLSVFEAFTETWAELCVILLQIHMMTKKDDKDVELILHNCLYYEQGWARIQCVKVLRHYGLTYQELFDTGSTITAYHETKTAVFSYYVLKCVLMHHLDAFLTWCRQASNGRGFTYIFHIPTINLQDMTPRLGFHRDNAYQQNLTSYCDFLVKWAQDPAYRKAMHRVEDATKRMYLGNELRMSLWGGKN